MPRGTTTVWTDEMIRDLIESFPVQFNKVIAERMGVSYRTIIRKARELGLEKEEGFVKKRQPEITKRWQKNYSGHPMKGVKGWTIPGRNIFKKGNIPAVCVDPSIREKIRATRNEIIRKEKLRLRYGLEQKTNLRLNTW